MVGLVNYLVFTFTLTGSTAFFGFLSKIYYHVEQWLKYFIFMFQSFSEDEMRDSSSFHHNLQKLNY